MREFANECFRQDVVGVQGKDPGRLDLLQAEIALVREGIEGALDDANVGKAARNGEGVVGAEAVHHDDLLCPAEPF